MKVVTIGLDVAKHIFQVHGADAEGQPRLRRRLRRCQVTRFFANVPTTKKKQNKKHKTRHANEATKETFLKSFDRPARKS